MTEQASDLVLAMGLVKAAMLLTSRLDGDSPATVGGAPAALPTPPSEEMRWWCRYDVDSRDVPALPAECEDAAGLPDRDVLDTYQQLLRHAERGHTLVTKEGSFRARRRLVLVDDAPSTCWGFHEHPAKLCALAGGPPTMRPIDVRSQRHDICSGNPTLRARSTLCTGGAARGARRGWGAASTPGTPPPAQMGRTRYRVLLSAPVLWQRRLRAAVERDVASLLGVPTDAVSANVASVEAGVVMAEVPAGHAPLPACPCTPHEMRRMGADVTITSIEAAGGVFCAARR